MHISDVPFSVIDWSKVAATDHPGETGKAIWRTFACGNLRVRMVDYSPGYRADHWCSRGHVVLVMRGELITELKDGRKFVLPAGTSYQTAENLEPHRSSTVNGATVFIVD
jgi:hypothetical protein